MLRIQSDLIPITTVRDKDEIPKLFHEYKGVITIRGNRVFQNGNFLTTFTMEEVSSTEPKPLDVIIYQGLKWFLTHDLVWATIGTLIQLDNVGTNVVSVDEYRVNTYERYFTKSSNVHVRYYYKIANCEPVQFACSMIRNGGFREFQGRIDAILLKTPIGYQWFKQGDKFKFNGYIATITQLSPKRYMKYTVKGQDFQTGEYCWEPVVTPI